MSISSKRNAKSIKSRKSIVNGKMLALAALAAAGLGLAVSGSAVHADTLEWGPPNGNGLVDTTGSWNSTSGYWYDTTNSTAGTIWSNGDDAVFGAAGTSAVTVTLTSSGISANSLTFNSGGTGLYYTIAGDLLTLSGNSITVNSNDRITASVTFDIGLDLKGNGTLTLASTNTFDGNTTIESGNTLDLSGTNTYDDTSTEGTSINYGATLNVTGSINSSVVDNGTFDVNSSIAITDLTGNGSISIGGGDIFTVAPTTADTFYGSISGSGALTIDGPSSLTLSDGTISYSGATTITEGTLALSNGVSLADSSGVSVANGATFDISGNDGGTTIKKLTGLGTVSLGSYNLTVEDAGTDSFGGIISDGGNKGSLTQDGAGTLTLSGINTYTGLTTISSGTLALSGNGSIADSSGVNVASGATFDISAASTNSGATINKLTGSGTVSLGSYTLTVDVASGNDTFSGVIQDGNNGGSLIITNSSSGTLTLSGVNIYTGGTTINTGTLALSGSGSIADSSYVDVAGGTFNVAAVTSGSVAVKDLAGTGGTVVLGSNTLDDTSDGTETFAGVISGLGGLTLTSSPTSSGGTLNLSGANTYFGVTTIGSATGEPTVLAVTSGTGTIGSGLLTVNKTGTFDMSAGASVQTVAGLSGSGAVNLGANSLTLNLPSSSTSETFSGIISGTNGSLTVTGPGTQTLTGANTYTGITTVESGATLVIGSGGSVAVGNDLTFGATGTDTFELNIGSGQTQEIGVIDDGGNVNATIDIASGTLEVVGDVSTTSSSFGGILTGSGTLEASAFDLTLTGNLSGFTGNLSAENDGSITVDSTYKLSSSTGLTVKDNQSIGLDYTNLNGNAVTFTGNTVTSGGGYLNLSGTNSTGALGAISITDGSGTTLDTIDGGGSTNTLNINGAITSANSTGSNTLILQNGNFVLASGSNSTGFIDNGTLQIGDGTTTGTPVVPATTVTFDSAGSLPGSTVGITLDSGEMKYAGSSTTIANNFTLTDSGSAITNIIDAGGTTLTLSGTITSSSTNGDTLLLQNGTFNLDPTNSATNDSTFTQGTLQVGGGTSATAATVEFTTTSTTAATSLPATGVGISLNDGELLFNTNATGSGSYSTTITNDITLSNTTGATTTNAIDAGDTFNGNSQTNTLTLSGNIYNTTSTNTLILQDGTFILNPTNSNSGYFTAGTLQIGNGATTTVNSQTVPETTVEFTSTGLPGSSVGISLNDGELVFNPSASGSYAIANNIKLSNTSSSGNIIDAGNTFNGNSYSNTVAFTGSITNSVSGNTLTLQDGTFDLTSASLSGFTAGSLQIGGGTGLAATAEFSSTGNLPATNVAITLDNGMLQQTDASTTIANAITLTTNTAATTDTLDAGGYTATVTGVISDGGSNTAATLQLTSSTSGGVVILNPLSSSGATTDNTYTGATDVTNGVTAVADSTYAFGKGALSISGNSTVDTINSYAASQNNLSAGATAMPLYAAGYTQDADSNLNLVALGRSSANTYDYVYVAGDAVHLNGTLNMTFSPTTSNPTFRPADFDTYSVVQDIGSNSTYTTASGGLSPTSTGATPIETGGVTYGSGWLNVSSSSPNLNYYETTSTANSSTSETVTIQTLFLPTAQTANEKAVAAYIDQNDTPDNNVPAALQTALGNLSQLTDSQISQTLAGLTPQTYGGLADEAFQNSTFLDQEIFNQTQNAFQGGGFNTSGLTLLKTSDQNPFAVSMDSAMQSAQQQAANTMSYMDAADDGSGSDNDYWYNSGGDSWYNVGNNAGGFSGFVLGSVTVDEQAKDNGYSQRDTTGGLLGGLDYRLNRNFIIGGFLNFNYTGGQVDNAGSGQQVNSYTPGLFAGYKYNNFYADALASYTYNKYRINRNINIPGSASVATGTPSGNQFDGGVLAGYNVIATKSLQLGPAAGVAYTHVDIDSFSESGSAFDMNVSQQNADSLRSLLGGQLQYTFNPRQQAQENAVPPITVNFNAYWQHEFLDSSRNISASFSQISGGQFVYGTPGPSRNSGLLDIGVSGYLGRGASVFVNYQTQIGANSQFAQTFMAGLAVNF